MKKKVSKKEHHKGIATTFTTEQIKQVETLAACLSLRDIGNYFGICQTTFCEIRKRQPEVEEAYRKGLANAKTLVASKLMSFINEEGFSQQKLHAIIFYLRTQGGWSEKQEMNVTTQDVTPTLPTLIIKQKQSYENELLGRAKLEESE